MTAKEIKDKVFRHQSSGQWEGYHFEPEEFATFWSQLCKEQREICADNAHWESGSETDPQYLRESIIDSPEPELD